MASLLERFLSNVSPEPMSGCWLWTAALNPPGGYGVFAIRKGEREYAHRMAWRLFVGEIPADKQIDHKCRVRSCVNPQHLDAVTQYENWRRGESVTARRLRRQTCVRGHQYNAANTRIDNNGHRHCRTCDREYREYVECREYAAAMGGK